jgi:hypothetical protein
MFDVNILLLYGEEVRAFLCLQKTIIQTSDDESIFAWTGIGNRGSGMLAEGPDCFAESGDIITDVEGLRRLPYSMTNRGLAIECDLIPYRVMYVDDAFPMLNNGRYEKPLAMRSLM